MQRFVYLVQLLPLMLLLLAGCDSDPAAPGNDLDGGVLATFAVEGETFHLWTTHPQTIQALFALRDGTSTASIPNGPLRAGPGQGNHNTPYTWHLDPAQTTMADLTIEVCDGMPSYVEAHREEWLDTVKQYCPWGAELVRLEDFR